jgi:hypothetical protein
MNKEGFEPGDTVRNKRNGRTGRVISRNRPIDGHVYAVQIQYFDDGKRPKTQSIETEKLESYSPGR